MRKRGEPAETAGSPLPVPNHPHSKKAGLRQRRSPADQSFSVYFFLTFTLPDVLAGAAFWGAGALPGA